MKSPLRSAALAALLITGCNAELNGTAGDGGTAQHPSPDAGKSHDGATGNNDDGGTGNFDDAGFQIGDGGASGDAGSIVTASVPARDCQTSFSYTPGRAVTGVAVAGEFNQWSTTANALTGPDSAGAYALKTRLPAGAHGYKIVVTETSGAATWLLDPRDPYSKFVMGTENSLVEVDDCAGPALKLGTFHKGPGGTAHADVQALHGESGAIDAVAVVVDEAPATPSVSATGLVSVDLSGLDNGKHRITVRARDAAGHSAELILPFWIETEQFDFRDGLMYFAFTDRFRNGDPTNDSKVTGVDDRANYGGGDFAGVQASIDDGYFDSLGVRTIWLSPPNANPDHAEVGTGNFLYTGYHGYWPTAGTTTQARFGSLADLKSLVKAAHKHGIRVIVDSVLNHVHKEHPFYQQHQADGWFHGDGTCICGGANCDWTTHALDCWFTDYLPDFDYKNFDAMKASIDDSMFWAKEADVDGFRVDAVKHFELAATKRLRSKLHDELEQAEPLYYLVGETFDSDRGLINSYIGPNALHAQFDFPLYFTLRDAFVWNSQTLRALEASTAASDAAFGTAPMSPFLGNHDVPRFLSAAAGMLWADAKAQAWSAPPGAPPDASGYDKLRLALTFVATQPGVPLIYYGDELGEQGADDPDNRRMLDWSNQSLNEQAVLAHTQKLGKARQELLALRRGDRRTIWVDDDLYVYTRTIGSQVAVVAINRGTGARSQGVPIPAGSTLSEGTTLHDRLGGADVTVTGGQLPLALPARSSAVLAP